MIKTGQVKEFTATIDTTRLFNEQGLRYANFENLLLYMQGLLYKLSTHNKNYTKEQERLINTIKDILNCMEAKNGSN